MTDKTKPEWARQDTAEPEPEPEPQLSPLSRPAKPAPGLKVRPAKRDSSTMILLLIAGMVAIGGVAFAAGRLTASPAAAAAASNRLGVGNGGGGFTRPSLAPGETFNAGAFGGGLGRGGAGGLSGGVTGTVQSIDGSTLTLMLSTGSTVTIDLSGSTTYHNETAGSSSDVKVGSKVQVQINTAAAASGTPNPSASGERTLTASDILVVTP
jgi:hypothetical protein